jgi:hypothetical protein
MLDDGSFRPIETEGNSHMLSPLGLYNRTGCGETVCGPFHSLDIKPSAN